MWLGQNGICPVEQDGNVHRLAELSAGNAASDTISFTYQRGRFRRSHAMELRMNQRKRDLCSY